MVPTMAGFIDPKVQFPGIGQGQGPATAKKKPASYRLAEEAQMRASVMREPVSPRVEKALARLDRQLASPQELRANVPRGFYINIEI